MSIKEDSVIGSILVVLKRRPDILALLLIVGGFLYYLDRHDSQLQAAQSVRDAREDIVANQRIQTCHDVQERAILSLERVSEVLQIHAESDARLSNEIDTLTITVSGNTAGLIQVEQTLSDLITEINMHQKFASLNYEQKH